MENKEFLLIGILAEGARTTITATASTVDKNDHPLIYEIDWGDGTPVHTGEVCRGVPFSLAHDYSHRGIHGVNVHVRDGVDGNNHHSVSVLPSNPI
jgi:hypothetical protein